MGIFHITLRADMTELEDALQRKTARQYWLAGVLAASTVTLLAVFSYTWLNFDSLYDPYLSAYPRVSTVFSPINMTVIGIVSLANGIAFLCLKRAQERLALVAFMLISHSDSSLLKSAYPPLLPSFLSAAGLPEAYSLSSLKKMNMRHFLVTSAPINRTIARNKNEWIALSKAMVSRS